MLQTTEGRIETSPPGALPDCHVGHVLVPAPRGVGGAARPPRAWSCVCTRTTVSPTQIQEMRVSMMDRRFDIRRAVSDIVGDLAW